MKQKEVTDSDNTKWTCVQAFSMTHNNTLQKEAALSENGKVTVVCTPTGGAKTVRLELSEKWEEVMKDEELIEAIKKEQSAN